jgi:hypothetical protein
MLVTRGRVHTAASLPHDVEREAHVAPEDGFNVGLLQALQLPAMTKGGAGHDGRTCQAVASDTVCVSSQDACAWPQLAVSACQITRVSTSAQPPNTHARTHTC